MANPESSQQEVLDEVVAEATDPGGAVGPGATQDLFEAGGADLGDSVTRGKAAVASDDDEDELWEFEDAVPTPARAEAAPAPPSPTPDPTQPAPPASPSVDPTEQVPPIRESDGDDLELESNLSGLDLAERPDEVATAAPMADTLVSEESGFDPMAGPDPSELTANAPAMDDSLDDEAEGLVGLGAPEDWDFLGESSASMAEAATFSDEAQPEPRVDRVAIADRVGIAAESDIFAERDSEQPVGEPIAAAVMADPAARAARPNASRGWQRPSLVPSANSLGWVLASALLLFGLSRALVPSPPPTLSAAEPRSFALSLGEARQVTGRFIDNAWAGPVFVVQGMYEPTDTPRGPTALRLRWLDADGNPIGDPIDEVAGDGLGEDELRELRPTAAAALLAGTGPDFRFGGAFSLVPGAIPEDAADFDLVLEVRPAPLRASAEEEAIDPGAAAD